jgi:hypothetical protein
MGLFSFLFVDDPKLPPKDPNDYTLTESSKPWASDEVYCKTCKKSCGHEEFMSSICNGCGSYGTQERFGRSYREIWNGVKWVTQFKYRNGESVILS